MQQNPKRLLMDFYLNLLAFRHNHPLRLDNGNLYAIVRDTLAAELGETPETIQNIFEAMSEEDAKF